MLECPAEFDWKSNPDDKPNQQLAALLNHYEQTHCDDYPQELRELLKACARALDPALV